MDKEPFRPSGEDTVNISVAATTANVALAGENYRQVRVVNDGSATAWIKFGDSTVTTAATTGVPVSAGATDVFSTRDTHVAAIAAAATGSIYFTTGSGY